MTERRLLLVEDEFLIRLTLAEALADDGFEVLEADSAEGALVELARHDEIAMILTDIQLSGSLDGRALAARARETRPLLPVMFMSGASDHPRSDDPRDHYVHKPYAPSTVLAAVRRILGRDLQSVRKDGDD